MATAPWATVAKQWTPSGYYQRKNQDGVGLLLATDDDAARDAIVQSVGINLMAAFYQQKLMEQFTREYPDTLAGMQMEYTRRLQMAQEFQNYAGTVSQANDPVSQVGMVSGFGVAAYPVGTSVLIASQGVYGQVVNLKPGYWFGDSSSTPFNSTFLAGQANPGDYLGDLNPNAQIGLYINQGTLAAPTWNAADSQTLTDLIFNPSVLLECGYERIDRILKKYAVDVPVGASLEWRYVYLAPAIEKQLGSLTEYEQLSFGLLRVDRAANGIISDSDKDASKVRKWIF